MEKNNSRGYFFVVLLVGFNFFIFFTYYWSEDLFWSFTSFRVSHISRWQK